MNPALQWLQWAWESSVAVSMATCKGGGRICGLIRLSQIQSRAKMDFLMRLLAALKTQIEFKRDRRRHQKTIWRRKAQWPGHPSTATPLKACVSPCEGVRRVIRPHCRPPSPQGWCSSGQCAAEMSQLPTRRKQVSGTVLEGVLELAVPESLWEMSPASPSPLLQFTEGGLFRFSLTADLQSGPAGTLFCVGAPVAHG